MNTTKYLQRISYKGTLEPSFSTLVALQKAHLLSVPFENLDIHHGIPIELDIPKLYNKIVERNRGGFCYELNGLFYELLKALDFEVKRVSARVYENEAELSPEYDHMTLLVYLSNAEYLVDVGFGKFAFGPIKLVLNTVQADPKGTFKMDKYNDAYWRVNKKGDAGWSPEYIFTEIPRTLEDFGGMCHYHQTSPESNFTKKRLCSLPTEEGRVTLSDDKLLITQGQEKQEIPIEHETAFTEALWQYFRMQI